MKKTNMVLAIIATLFTLQSAPVQAQTTPLGVTLALGSSWTTFIILEDATAFKQTQVRHIADDAAAFIMNDGKNPSALLSAVMAQARNDASATEKDKGISDLELARLILDATTASVKRVHPYWHCTGGSILKTVSFTLSTHVENISVTAPDLDQNMLSKMFNQVNEFTISATQVIDIKAQETLDFTLLIDNKQKNLTVFSKWSTNEGLDVEVLKCSVTD